MLLLAACISIPVQGGSQTALPKPQLVIVAVHSYNVNHPCTAPQEKGFLSRISELSNRYDVRIRTFYMDAKINNVTTGQRERAAEIILEKIRNTKPDFIYMSDDVAFEYVGIQLARRGYMNSNGTMTPVKMFVSGINRKLSDYITDTRRPLPKESLPYIIAVEETIYLDKLFPILSRAHFRAAKWYIIWDQTETSDYMLQNYNRELLKFGVLPQNIDTYKFETIEQLKKFIESTQNEQQGVYVLAFQALKDEKKNLITKDALAWVFTGRNLKHLELSGNPLFVQYGYAIGCGPDFEAMGVALSNHLVDVVMKTGFKGIILHTPTNVSINIKRLRELNLNGIVDENFNIIKQTYQGY